MTTNNTNGNEILGFIEEMEQRDAKVSAQLQELQQQLTENKSEEVARLRKVLMAAKGKLLEQQGMLEQLTAEPLVRAPIISLCGGDRSLIQEGVVVRIRPGFNHENEIGTVSEVYKTDRGEIRDICVKFNNGEYWYTIDLVQCSPVEQGDFAETVKVGKFVVANENISNDLDHVGVKLEILEVHEDDGVVSVKCPVDPTYTHEYRYKLQLPMDVIRQSEDSVVIFYEGKHVQVKMPVNQEVSVGNIALLSMRTLQIVKVVEPVALGEPTRVRRVVDKDFVEVDSEGSIRVAASGKFAGKLEEGDRVLLDLTSSVVIINLGKEDHRFSVTRATNTTWNDIGGLAEAKKQMIEAIEMPVKYADIYAAYGKKPIKGVLMYGPPGCGKTLLAKAAATALADLHGSNGAETGFIYVKGPEILDRYVGVAEATIRQIFLQARKHKEKHGYPAVIFIDEADAILAMRGSGVSSDMERTIVPMFLAEMDGLEDSGAVVLLSTNRPDVLDPAITRDGRIDRKVKVERPDHDSAVEVFKLHLRGVPFNNGYTVEDIAKLGRDELFSNRNRLYDIHVTADKKEKVIPFTLGHLINGAMIAGIVDQATSLAVHRDIANGGEPKGITKADIEAAVQHVFAQNHGLNHKDELAEFVRDFRQDVVQVKRTNRVAAVNGQKVSVP